MGAATTLDVGGISVADKYLNKGRLRKEGEQIDKSVESAFAFKLFPKMPELTFPEDQAAQTRRDELADAPFRSLYRRSRGKRAFRVPLRNPGVSTGAIPSASSLRIV